MSRSPAELATLWLDAWNRGEPDRLPLADDFVHTRPFGRFEGAAEYLRVVEPMSRRSVESITILDVVEGPGRAAIRYEVATPAGPGDCCIHLNVH